MSGRPGRAFHRKPITKELKIKIRSLWESGSVEERKGLALRFGVSTKTIGLILRGTRKGVEK